MWTTSAQKFLVECARVMFGVTFKVTLALHDADHGLAGEWRMTSEEMLSAFGAGDIVQRRDAYLASKPANDSDILERVGPVRPFGGRGRVGGALSGIGAGHCGSAVALAIFTTLTGKSLSVAQINLVNG